MVGETLNELELMAAQLMKKESVATQSPSAIDHLRLLHARLVDLRAEIDAIVFPSILEPGAMPMETRKHIKDAAGWMRWAEDDLAAAMEAKP